VIERSPAPQSGAAGRSAGPVAQVDGGYKTLEPDQPRAEPLFRAELFGIRFVFEPGGRGIESVKIELSDD